MKLSLIKKIIFVIMFVLGSLTINAQIIYVKQGSVGTGTSWANARGDLYAAIGAASSGTQIWVAEGTYYPTATANRSIYFYLKNGVEIYGGFPNSGSPIWTDRNYSTHLTIMSGDIGVVGTNTDNSYHIVYNSGTINNTAILDGFILQDGHSNVEGGGIYLRNASPIIRNCIIRNNYCLTDGAGMYMRDNCSLAVFTNCTFSNNDADDDGGGIVMTNANCNPTFNNCTIDSNHGDGDGGGVTIYSCSPVFSNCTITNNVIDLVGINGGGFFINGTSNPSITNCTISNNKATNLGGGIYTVSTTLTNPISGNIIDGNIVIDGSAFGGGIYLDNSKPNITGNTISNNTATTVLNNASRGYGGGIYVNGNDLDVLISNNTFSNNSANTSGSGNTCGRGGAIYLFQAPAIIQNNIIQNNSVNTTSTGTACGEGGGIYIYQSLSSLISANTISGNTAIRFGGGIYMYQSNPTLTNNTIDANIVNSAYNNEGNGGGICIYDNTASGLSPILNGNTISNNQANDNGHLNSGFGGGLIIQTGVSPEMTSNIIENNSSSQRGGGIYIRDNTSVPILNRNVIKNNNSAQGGGVYLIGTMAAGFYNNLIFENNATNGGGIYFNGNDAGIFLNNTVANNTGTDGTGIYFNTDADLYIKNSNIWGNTIYINDGNSDPYFQYCDVQGGTVGFAGAGAGAAYTAGHYSNNIEIDPLFSDGIFHITLGTSPCIGAGNPATVTGNFPADADFDASKRVRGIVDIGAYETNNYPQFVTLPYPPLTDNPGPINVTMDEDANPTAFALTLSAIDIDNEGLTWSVFANPSHGIASATANTSIPNPQNNNIIYSPTSNYNGTDNFKIQISDGTLTDLIQVNVTINAINDAPTFVTNPNPLVVKSNKSWTYNVVTSDVDNALNTLTLSCLAKPAAMSFSAGANGTGILSWTPTDLDVSPPNYTVTLRIQDPNGAFTDQTFVLTVSSRIINVPADYLQIQQAINAATDGEDKIIIADGTYAENINTNGKTIEIVGNTLDPTKVKIDGQNLGPCIVINQGGSPSIRGISLINGSGQVGLISSSTVHAPASGYYGGAIVVNQSSPTLIDLIISGNNLGVNNNHGGSGGGIYIGNNSVVTIMGSTIAFEVSNNNSTTYRGGGICIDDSKLTIQNADISNNHAGDYGGGIAAFNSTVDLTNVSINSNSVTGRNGSGGGVYSHHSTINIHAGVNITGNSASVNGNNQYTYP